jgi:hypothetical protein
MALSEEVATAGLVIGVTLVAAALAMRQWHERRRREPNLSGDDARHFARQDFRRAVVGVVLLLLALSIAFGSRLEPRPAGRPSPLFLAVWLGIFGLVFVLVWLAVFDFLATWLYARRHRRAIARERIEYLRGERRRQSYRGNGRTGPPGSIDGPPTA